MLGVCGGLERTDFYHLLLWEFVVVLKELIFLGHLLLWEFVVVLKELIFYHLLLWEFVVVMKELIFDSF